ncbi:MAG: tRNA pseudouridine(13) synthase TruD [Thermoplasmata archaeon]
MSAPGPSPSRADRAIGIDFYWTRSPGAPGRLKLSAQDFEVSEISAYPTPDPAGPQTILRIESENWEQHELAEAIARRLRLPPHALQWAGTKDRRAVSTRLFSYLGPPPEGDLGLPRVRLIEAYRAREGLSLGHHYGNSFSIRIETAGPPGEAISRYAEVRAELEALGGFPNLFGPQRFGEVRPITHEVGRALVRGDGDRAVEIYLVDSDPTSSTPGSAARRAYAEHRDPARALREFPPAYRFERTLLERLARGYPADRALRGLSRELRLLFIHAYQSLLFNGWVSGRIARGLSLDRPVEGDYLLRVGRDGTLVSHPGIPVGPDNLAEATRWVQEGGARLAGPLVGYATPPSRGVPGEILEEILGREGVTRESFRVFPAPEVASAGAFRPVLVPTPAIALQEVEAGVRFGFSLPKGAYATVLLREFLKSPDPAFPSN